MSNNRGLLLPAKFNSRGERKQIDKHAHHLVVETAKSMAHAVYEKAMKNNAWYGQWKRTNPGLTPKELENRFVLRLHGTLINEARATLAHMLTLPSTDDLTRERIYESLLLDKTLTRGRLSGSEVTAANAGKGH